MMYNKKYGILFKFNPIMQCMLGQFNGWRLVIEAYNDSRGYDKENDKVNFTYGSQSQYNKLVKHIQGV